MTNKIYTINREDLEEQRMLEAVSKLKAAAKEALHLLRFAKPTPKREEVIKDLKESLSGYDKLL